jgi:hypothetical protein
LVFAKLESSVAVCGCARGVAKPFLDSGAIPVKPLQVVRRQQGLGGVVACKCLVQVAENGVHSSAPVI